VTTGDLKQNDVHLPAGIDPNRPSAARIYDYFLGGTHNFAADRALGDRAMEMVPKIPRIAQANRAFLRRAVRHAAASGVRQFLDLGSGIPTEGNVHDVARAVHSDARVVYVDREPTAVLHAQDILGADPTTVAVQGDLQDPRPVLDHPDVRHLLDLDEPVCILMIAVLHFIPDSPALTAALRMYNEAAAPGSFLAVTHTTNSSADDVERIADLYNRTGTPLVPRDRGQIAGLLTGWRLLDPGVVYTPLWRPDSGDEQVADPASYLTCAAMAEKVGDGRRPGRLGRVEMIS
jgi:hypothetical protein